MRNAPANKSSRLRFCALAGLGLAGAGMVFLALIQFQLREFLEAFRMHSRRLEHGTLDLLYRYLHDLEPGWVAILWLAFLVLCASIRRPMDNLSRLCYCVAGVFALMGLNGALGHGSSWYVIFVLLLLAGRLVRRFPDMLGKMLPWTIAVLLLVADSTALIGALGQLTGKIEQKPPENLESIRQSRSTEEQPLLLDASVARYAFDYRLPAGCIDFEFAAPFPGFTATDAKPRDGDLYLLSPGAVEGINAREGRYYPIDWWNAFGLLKCRQFKYPHQIYFISARNFLQGSVAAQTVR